MIKEFKATHVVYHSDTSTQELMFVAQHPLEDSIDIYVTHSGSPKMFSKQSVKEINKFEGREPGDPVWVRDNVYQFWLLREYYSPPGASPWAIYARGSGRPPFGFNHYTFEKPTKKSDT